MRAADNNQVGARLRLVEEHVRRENEHDLLGIMQTFGPDAQYDDEPWGEHHRGRHAVEQYYADLLTALPDLRIDIRHRFVTGDAIVLEVAIAGTHTGAWRGLPATGRRVQFPLCAVYSFDETGKLAGERIYYDRATVLHQVGLFHEPRTRVGRLLTVLAHPLTVGRALSRAFRSRPAA